MLYRGCAERLAEPGQIGFPRVPVIAQHSDLDEFMGGDGPSRFQNHRLAEALGADHDHGLQGVGLSFKKLTLFGGELP